ncbi:MAG: hypothetical protein ACM3JQ_02745 [Candidatus Eiseniibacteriota bacterium]
MIDIQTDPVGRRIITTKGDNNPSPIPGTDFPIKKDNYIGKVTSVITRVQKKIILFFYELYYSVAFKNALFSDWDLNPQAMLGESILLKKELGH